MRRKAHRIVPGSSPPRHPRAGRVVHVVGSNNDLQPWFGAAETPLQTAQRLAECQARLAATLDWLDETFAVAHRKNAKAVVVAMQRTPG